MLRLFTGIVAVLLLSGCGAGDQQETSDQQEAGSSELGLTDDADSLLPVRENGQWGYIDRTGRLAIEPQYERAWRFSGGLALVRDGQDFGYIRPDGSFAIEPRFDDGWHFTDGLAPVEVDGQWSYLDTTGAVIADTQMSLPPEVLVEERYNDDRFQLVESEGRYGFRSEDGERVIDPRFEQAWRFSDGLARAKLDGKWGYIDREGEFAIEPAYDLAWDFRSGLAMVQVGDTIAYINRDGEMVWPNPR